MYLLFLSLSCFTPRNETCTTQGRAEGPTPPNDWGGARAPGGPDFRPQRRKKRKKKKKEKKEKRKKRREKKGRKREKTEKKEG